MKAETYRGLWKILNAQGRFVSWATGTFRDAAEIAQKCGCEEAELIPWPES